MLRFRSKADRLPFGDDVEEKDHQAQNTSREYLSTKRRWKFRIYRKQTTSYIGVLLILLLFMSTSDWNQSASQEEASNDVKVEVPTLQDTWMAQRAKWTMQNKGNEKKSKVIQRKKQSNQNYTRVEDFYKPNYAASLMEMYRRFPNTNGTELSFSKMAFQTNLYAQILRDDSLDEETLSRYESNLWSFFVPGISNLRKGTVLSAKKPKWSSKQHFQQHYQQQQQQGKPRRGIVMPTNEGRIKYACHFYEKSTRVIFL